jgi:hypothetical protein
MTSGIDPSGFRWVYPQFSSQGAESVYEALKGQPLVLWNTVDVTSEGSAIGTSSLLVRVFYVIRRVVAEPLATFYHITALNQGTKTCTVNGDASALGGSIAVVGSTGNNGTYTVVSATAGEGDTAIVVAEAIPSAVADGWIKQ